MTKTWCVGGRHMSNPNNNIEFEKLNPKTNKLVKIIKGTCNFCSRNKSQFFFNKRLEDKILFKKEDVKINTIHQCLIVLGLICKAKVIFLNYMINAPILNVIV